MTQYPATITQKGQITIPKALRQMLGLVAYGTVTLSLSADKKNILLSAQPSILDLAGTFKPKKGKSVLKARDSMEKSYKRF